MTDFPAHASTLTTGTVVTERSGAAIGVDTVPAGATVLARNTGAGTHTLILVSSWSVDNLTVPNRTITLTAGQVQVFRVRPEFGDVNSRVNMYVGEGTQTEVKYYVLSGG